jgi:hypothetical protein
MVLRRGPICVKVRGSRRGDRDNARNTALAQAGAVCSETGMPFREENDDIQALFAGFDHRDHGGRVPALRGSGTP